MKARRTGLCLLCGAVLATTPLGLGCGGGGGGGGTSGSGTATITGNVSSASTAALDAEKRSWLAWAGEELLGLARRAYAATNGPGGVAIDVTGATGGSSTDTDSGGRFAIANAPTGDVMVSFGRDNCKASIPLDDVTAGSTLDMKNVAIDCNRATVGELDETFQGVIENKPASANGNLNVCAFGGGGNHIRAVKTRGSDFEDSDGQPLAFNDLQEGDLIEVTGQRAGIGANSAVNASNVRLVSSGNDTGNCTGLPAPTP